MTQTSYRTLASAALLAFALLFLVSGPARLTAQAVPQPDIRITEVPPSTTGGPDAMYPIAGTVSGVPAKDYRVVVYVYAGSQWFVQPFDYAPLTEIRANLKFETETHGGMTYAVLLVKAGYKAAATLVALPDVGGDVAARHRVAGKRE